MSISENIVRQLNSQDANFAKDLKQLLAFDAADDAAIDAAAAKILADVRARGDAAVLEYTQKFDRLSKEQASSIKALEISKADLQAALQSLPKEQKLALEAAAARVKSYHERQKNESGCHSWD